MQPTRVKSSSAEDVKLLSNVLYFTLSVYFPFEVDSKAAGAWNAATAERQRVLRALNI